MIPLGPFELDTIIGKGAMGEVWSGRHRIQGLPVAVKLLTAERARDEHFRASFRNEARLVAGLDHPNVVRVFDFGEVGEAAARVSGGRVRPGLPWLAMERVDGGTLKRLRGRIAWEQLEHVIEGLLAALAHAHARGVVHRDLKPSNVLVGGRGRGLVKLTDFGVAHALKEHHPEEDEEILSMFSGTPAYMAPEQFIGRWRDYGPWTDLYALGCLLWTLVTGQHLYGRRSVEQRAYAHLEEPLPALEPEMPLPRGFEDWLRHLLAKHPRNRFQRAADAAFAFRRLGAPGGARRLSDRHLRAIPPLPRSWRAERPSAEGPEPVGAGLGLFGLRAVPVVDREAERDGLWGALAEVRRERQPRVLALQGASGCGKSRLAGWLSERAHEVGAAIALEARHSHVPGPGHGLGPMVARFAGCQGLDRAGIRERLARVLRRWGHESSDDLDVLTEWVAPATAQDTQAGARAIRFGSASERYVVLHRVLGALCRERPVVVWMDDVQWGLDALNFVSWTLERDAELPVLFVLTATDGPLAETVIEAAVYEELLGHPEVGRVEVGPLEPRWRPELVRRLLGLEPELAQRVEEATGGHPMFAVQLVGDWVERGILEPGAEGFTLQEGASPDLPGSLEQVWADRVARVLEGRSERQAKALEIAAILGRDVEPDEWHAVCDIAGAHPSTALVETLLDLRLAECGEAGPAHGWSWVHVTLREALEHRARRQGRLRTLHRLCANLLVDREGPDQMERLGRHLVAAGDPHAALEPLLDAIATKIRRGEHDAAEALVTLREEALRAADVDKSNPLWGEGWLSRFRIATQRGDYAGAQRWLDHAEAAAVRHAWRTMRVRIRKEQGTLARQRSDFRTAVAVLTQAETEARRLGDPRLLAELHRELAEALADSGELADAETRARTALRAFLDLGDDVGCARCWHTMGEVKKLQGAHDQAARLLRNAQELYEEAGARWGLASACNSLGDVLRYQGDHAGAEQHYARAGALFRAVGSGSAVTTEYNRALCLLERGRHADAQPVLQYALDEWARQGRIGAQGDAHLALAGVAALAGDWAAWDRHFRSHRQYLERSGSSDEDTARLAEFVARRTAEAGQASRARQALQSALAQWESLDRTREFHAARSLLPGDA